MRFVERDRIAPPRIFASDEARFNRQRVLDVFMSGAMKRSQSRVERQFALAEHVEVRVALAELFDGTCAFCETPLTEPQVYRFRPAEGAHPITEADWAHLYYAWLADAWQNLYPICNECLPEDPFRFPVSRGQRSPLPNPGQLQEYIERDDGRWPFFPLDESPILVDPCYDRKLWRHFRFLSDGSVAAHRGDRRGRETIAHFSLDRPSLTAARRSAFETNFLQLRAALATGEQGNAVFDRWRAPAGENYTGAWFLHLRELLALALGRSPAENIHRLAQELRQDVDWRDRLDRARDQLLPGQAWLSASEARREKRTAAPGREPRSIVIRNFKSLENITVRLPVPSPSGEPRAAALLMLGENAAGKSTILEAIAIALMDAEVRRLLDLKAGRLFLNPHYLGADAAPRPAAAEIELSYAGGESQSLRIEPSSQDSAKRYLPQDFLEKGPHNPIPLFAYGAFRQYLDTERRYQPHKHLRSLFHPNELLSNPEPWLLRLSQDQFNMAVRALRAVFSIEGEFEVLERRDKAVYVVQRLGDAVSGPLQRTPLDIVSSGFRAVLAMLCDIMQGLMDPRVNPGFQTLETARGIALIDEIEAHLHPRWKMAIMSGLRRALPQVTFIATSHDPLCLRGVEGHEVVVLERIPGQQAQTGLPVFTQCLVDLPDNRHWTIEQLLTADFFQLRSTANVDAERRMARMQDKLATGIKPADDPELQAYLDEISGTLPIGDTKVHRLVQEAVATFLAEERQATQDKLKALKEDTRQAIVAALRGAA